LSCLLTVIGTTKSSTSFRLRYNTSLCLAKIDTARDGERSGRVTVAMDMRWQGYSTSLTMTPYTRLSLIY
jgi:hypothetical protein